MYYVTKVPHISQLSKLHHGKTEMWLKALENDSKWTLILRFYKYIVIQYSKHMTQFITKTKPVMSTVVLKHNYYSMSCDYKHCTDD